MLGSLKRQISPLIITSVFTIVPAVLFLAAIALIAPAAGVEIQSLTKDFSAAARVPFYTGVVSNVGIYLWCAAAAICLFGFLVLWAPARRDAWFLLASGALTAMLFVDDAFLVHEVIGPYHLGIGSDSLMLSYLACTLAYLVALHRRILTTNFLILGMALGFFAMSFLADKLHDTGRLEAVTGGSQDIAFLIEDGLKLAGISAWLGYFVSTCLALIAARMKTEEQPTAHTAHALGSPP